MDPLSDALETNQQTSFGQAHHRFLRLSGGPRGFHRHEGAKKAGLVHARPLLNGLKGWIERGFETVGLEPTSW